MSESGLQKKMIKGFWVVILLNAIIKPLWLFVIDRKVQLENGPEEYGQYYSIFGFCLLWSVLLDPGLHLFNTSKIGKDERASDGNFKSLFSLKIALSVLYFSVCLIVGILFLQSDKSLELLVLMILGQVFASMIQFIRSFLAGKKHFYSDAILSVADRTLTILLCGLFLFDIVGDNVFTVSQFAFWQLIAYFSTFLLAIYLLIHSKVNFRFHINWKRWKYFLMKGLPYAILILLMSFYTRIDVVLLPYFREDGFTQSGYYAASYRILDALNIFPLLLSGLLLPTFSAHLKNQISLQDSLRIGISLAIPLSIFLSAFIAVFSFDISAILYPNNTQEIANCLQILIPLFFFNSLVFVFGTLLTAANKLKSLILIAGIGFLINAVSNFVLLPILGAQGAAYSALFSLFFVSAAQIIMVVKRLKISFSISFYLNYLLFAALVLFAILAFKQFDISVFFAFILGSIISLLFAILFKLIDIKKGFELLLSKQKS